MSMVVGRSSDSKEDGSMRLERHGPRKEKKGTDHWSSEVCSRNCEFFPMTVNLSTASLYFPMFSNLGIQQP